MEPVVLGLVVVALLVAVRHFAARRVLARQGQFVWLMFIAMLAGGVVILWAGIQLLATVPIAGVATTLAGRTTLAGSLYLALMLRVLARLSRSVSSAGRQDDIGTAVTEPLVDYLGTTMGLMLVGGVVAVVALIVWGISQAAR
jgi:hypothetical protein